MREPPDWVVVGRPPSTDPVTGRPPPLRLSPEPRRILAIKLADVGDALLATPALAALRAAYPAAKLDALVTPGAREALAGSQLIDEFVVLDARSTDRRRALPTPAALHAAMQIRRRGYDTVLLFHHLTTRSGSLKHAALLLACGAPRRAGLAKPASRRGWFLTHRAADCGFDGAHEVEAAMAVAAAAGAAVVAKDLVFHPGDAAESAAEALLAELGPPGTAYESRPGPASPVIAIHPGAGPYSPARRWPAAGFAAVAEHAHRRHWRVVLVGREGDATHAVRERTSAPLLDLTGRTDLATLGAVLRRMNAVVANDGGVMHLAAAMKTPVVGVFGPSNPRAWGPWPGGPGSPHRVVALSIPCRPCFYVGHRLGAPNGCATRDCLRWLDARWVIHALDDVMDGVE